MSGPHPIRVRGFVARGPVMALPGSLALGDTAAVEAGPAPPNVSNDAVKITTPNPRPKAPAEIVQRAKPPITVRERAANGAIKDRIADLFTEFCRFCFLTQARLGTFAGQEPRRRACLHFTPSIA